MIFTTNKPSSEWGKVLHDEDLAGRYPDRILERGRFIHLDGRSWRTRRLNLEEPCRLLQNAPEFPELACRNFRNPHSGYRDISTV
jgi:hypothetical protein